jgi:putative FmdB family regulatory protein
MPRYDYRCRACGDTFEVTRSISAPSEVSPCPQGHDDTVKLLSTIALTGRGGVAVSAPRDSGAGGGGGCCGGGCGCG